MMMAVHQQHSGAFFSTTAAAASSNKQQQSNQSSSNIYDDISQQESLEQRIQHDQQKKAEQREFFANKKGRGWSDPWEIIEMMEAKTSYEDLPDWEKKYVSRISSDRLRVLDHTLTLTELAALPLPNHPCGTAHPAKSAKLYALSRRRHQQRIVSDAVREMAKTPVAELQNSKQSATMSWEEKQIAVDILFEDIEANLKRRFHVLGKHPHFGTWVEKSLEQYLQEVQPTKKNTQQSVEPTLSSSDDDNTKNNNETTTLAPEATVDNATATNTATTLLPTALDAQNDDDSTIAAPVTMTVVGETATTTTTTDNSDNDSALPLSSMMTNLNAVDADNAAVPIFLDCYRSGLDKDNNIAITANNTEVVSPSSNIAPTLLHPLRSNPKRPTNGRMVEEWELAADRTTRRIMLRQSTRAIARALAAVDPASSSLKAEDGKEEEDNMGQKKNIPHARVLVTGRQGTGKTAALAAIVATARTSGAIVLYLPEGDNMSQNGYYIVPNAKRPGYYDLPVLQSEVCADLLTTHRKQLEDFTVDATMLEEYCTEPILTRLRKRIPEDQIHSLVALLEYGVEHKPSAPAIFMIALHLLMTQTAVNFYLVMDEFNCLFRQPGHYFHATYDFNVVKSIPHEKITLFEPIMNTMGLTDSPMDDDDITNKDVNDTSADTNAKGVTTTKVQKEVEAAKEIMTIQPPRTIQRGGVVVATTESHAVARKFTDALIQAAQQDSGSGDAATGTAITVIDIPRLSPLEVEHMLSHYEAIGIGKLRLDRGETVMNPQEVAYLRMVSGGEAQHLMNACMW
jgi:Mitochondrial ribosomal death-associated protein 3